MRLAAFLVLPAVVLAYRLGWLARRDVRWGGALLLAALACSQFPAGGVADFALLERGKFLLAAAVALWLVAPRLGVDWVRDPRRDRAFLAVAAVLSVTLHLNFFAFHGLGVYVHHHDLGHYYLGSKYFPELGYGTLYAAILQAESESAAYRSPMARDLATGEMKPIDDFAAAGEEAKRRFAPDRWESFRRDVAFFRGAMPRGRWAAFTADHGFNATPAWIAIGGAVARRVPATPPGILALGVIDSVLLVALFAVIAVVYGARAMLLCLTHYCVVYGAGSGWTGGGFLRFLWLVAAVLGVCLLERGWHALAGASLAAASALAVFPVFLFVSLGIVVLARFAGGAGIGAAHRRVVLSFAVTLAGMTGGAMWLVGPNAWGFRDNIAAHVESPAINRMGLEPLLTMEDDRRSFLEAYAAAKAARRSPAFPWLRGMALLATIGLVVACRNRIDDAEASVLGLALVFVAVTLSAYYYSVLVVWTLVFRHRPGWLLGVFGLEAATGAMALFEQREWVVYLHRSALLGSLYLAAFAAILTRRTREERRPAPAAP